MQVKREFIKNLWTNLKGQKDIRWKVCTQAIADRIYSTHFNTEDYRNIYFS